MTTPVFYCLPYVPVLKSPHTGGGNKPVIAGVTLAWANAECVR